MTHLISFKKKQSVWLVVSAATIALLVWLLAYSSPPAPADTNEHIWPTAAPDSMVCIPGGLFWMGSDSGEIDERPLHRVELDTFYIDVVPITNAFYAQFLTQTAHRTPKYWNDPRCNHPRQPVVGVSFDDALAFCQWRSKKDTLSYRLPTEAEWEKAARGADKRFYPWGNDKPTPNHAANEIAERMPLIGMCALGASPYGVHDMVGTVWNWCIDKYDKNYYSTSPAKNPTGPLQGRHRVVRGGNWLFLGCCSGTPAYALRTTRRNAFHESMQKKSIGFRCVRER